MSCKKYEANGCGPKLGLLIKFATIVCFISYKKCVQREKYPK